jgi:hypothetical protein
LTQGQGYFSSRLLILLPPEKSGNDTFNPEEKGAMQINEFLSRQSSRVHPVKYSEITKSAQKTLLFRA